MKIYLPLLRQTSGRPKKHHPLMFSRTAYFSNFRPSCYLSSSLYLMTTLWKTSSVEPTLFPLYDCKHLRYGLVHILTYKHPLVHVKLWLTSVPRFFFDPFLWRKLTTSTGWGSQKKFKGLESLFMNSGSPCKAAVLTAKSPRFTRCLRRCPTYER